MISAIVAVDENYGIGYKGDLLFHIKDDLKNFKKITSSNDKENFVIMGRKTYDSLPTKPLPNRFNIVITRNEKLYWDDILSPSEKFAYINLDIVKHNLVNGYNLDKHDTFIIGGGEIYKELLPYCEKLYITKVLKSYENVDAYFPNIDEMSNWELESASDIKEEDGIRYQFCIYKNLNK